MRGRALFVFAVTFGVTSLGGAPAPDARAATGAPCGGGGPAAIDASDDGGDDAGNDASDDGGVCAANEYCALPDGGAIVDGAAGTCATQSCGGSSGACAVNVYCGLPDAGLILDGAAGVCTLEPCVLASDCTDPDLPICDTSQNPYACVACISTADCPGILVCDIANHTCVNPPPVPDASAGDGGALLDGAAEDGGEDGSLSDGGAPGDGSAYGDGSTGSASDTGPGSGGSDASDGSIVPPPANQGSLAGGAWDCDLAPDGSGSLAALALPLACAALFASRRRRRARRARD